MSMARVVVIGGGWAGCGAAVRKLMSPIAIACICSLAFTSR